MTIGFGNGNFYQLYKHDNDRFNELFLSLLSCDKKANAIELHTLNEEQINILLDINKDILKDFDYISLHSPDVYNGGIFNKKLMEKIKLLNRKFNFQNIVYHPDRIIDFNDLSNYKELPISMENMDNDKTKYKTVEDMKYILDKYNFGFTLDLQHCYVNDPSMKLAEDFHNKLGDKIVEYHISAYKEGYPHHTLFQNNQDMIIKSLQQQNAPIIIESAFDAIGDHEMELDYIINSM